MSEFSRPSVQLFGRTGEFTAFARINTKLRQHLAQSSKLRLLDPSDPRPPDVGIHHDYSVDFVVVTPLPAGRRIAMRTWDFGPYPPSWTERLRDHWDELWAPSQWVAAKAVESGVNPDRVRVVPFGVDPSIMNPNGDSLDAVPRGHFCFLFVGAGIKRKGLDILLAAYAQAFSHDEPVSLVVKDRRNDVFYQGIRMAGEIRRRNRQPGHPRIVLIEGDLSATDLAALYRRAQATVFPYRAEGFAMPILESMACGVSPIVPRFGACLDYCSVDSAFFVEPKRIRVPAAKRLTINTLGFEAEIEELDFCEIPVAELARTLRRVYEMPAGVREAQGHRAAGHARKWTWSAVAARIEECIG